MSPLNQITLYSYYYSSASWRVRATLALKNIPFKYETVQLLDGAQHEKHFLSVNPMHQVPAIKVQDKEGKSHLITQSLAIIEFLEELYPEKSVYPKDIVLKAKARAIADTISSGIQPLQNLETLVDHEAALGREPLSAADRKKVAAFWINRKLLNLEALVKQTAGQYCIGDQVTLADICLVPQMFNARRFEVDTSKFPLLKDIDQRLQELDIFKVSHPFACPDSHTRLESDKA